MLYRFFWIGVFLFLLLVLIGLSEWLHKQMEWPSEKSRKFLHVSGGLMCLSFPIFFTSHWEVLILTAVVFIVLMATYRRKLLPSVHQTKRYSIGSVLFPIPVYFCFLIATFKGNYLFYYLPVSLLTIADAAAEIGGNKWGHLTTRFFKGQKTLAGSLSFFFASVIVSFIWLFFVFHLPANTAFLIGTLVIILSTIAELITLHGWDNLSIPAVTIAILLCFAHKL